jgi:D-hydroxyproline dehydrogenase subunit gamma
MSRRFVRVAERERAAVEIRIDGQAAQALVGDTLLVALLTNGLRVRDSEFGDGARAGFCLMGACQDCWVWSERGERIRACSTPVVAGLSVLTRPPAAHWPMTPDLEEQLGTAPVPVAPESHPS